MQFSVLMSVYLKEKPEQLQKCIESLLCQTKPADQIVLVLDGPLSDALWQVINTFAAAQPHLFTVVPLLENVGIGMATNIGLDYCRHDLIAKMDSDDICREDRFAKQLEEFEKDPDLALLGSYLAEFLETPDKVVAVRKVPLKGADIYKYARRRDPFNNQTVMYKKRAVQDSGGYSPLRRCEDYDLFVRMLAKGYQSRNLPEVLVYYRLSENVYRRRGSWQNLRDFVSVRWNIYRRGFSNLLDFLIPCTAQLIFCILPRFLRDIFYRRLLRK